MSSCTVRLCRTPTNNSPGDFSPIKPLPTAPSPPNLLARAVIIAMVAPLCWSGGMSRAVDSYSLGRRNATSVLASKAPSVARRKKLRRSQTTRMCATEVSTDGTDSEETGTVPSLTSGAVWRTGALPGELTDPLSAPTLFLQELERDVQQLSQCDSQCHRL